jgi:hypothetical protein
MEFASYAEKEPDRFRRGGSWKINLFGRNSDVPSPDLQAFRLDFDAGHTLDAHFHIVDQFQIFIAGGGTIGRASANPVTVHYADHHTGYGPIVAGPDGLSYLTLRSRTDAGLVKLSTPDVRDRLRPTKRRHRTSDPIALSDPADLRARIESSVETVIAGQAGDDGMGAVLIRLGPGMTATVPDPAGSGGQYLIVMAGTLVRHGADHGPYSIAFVRPGDAPPTLVAGDGGLEMIVARFPTEDAWMASLGAN